MGLTIHYHLKTDQTEIDSVRTIVQEFHRLAKAIPFQEVGEVLEFQNSQCRYDDSNDPHRWLKIQAGHYVEHTQSGYLKVIPLHIIAFTTVPGEGSEPANIGLCRYPSFVEGPAKRRIQTNLPGWSWSSFCKTQYASDPSVGGTPNFIRCHLSVITLLDAIQKHNLAAVEVSDEGDYWDHRDVRKLAETVGEWNQLIAAAVGQFKDVAAGLQFEAPITEFLDFEHLEAKGQDTLKKRS